MILRAFLRVLVVKIHIKEASWVSQFQMNQSYVIVMKSKFWWGGNWEICFFPPQFFLRYCRRYVSLLLIFFVLRYD